MSVKNAEKPFAAKIRSFRENLIGAGQSSDNFRPFTENRIKIGSVVFEIKRYIHTKILFIFQIVHTYMNTLYIQTMVQYYTHTFLKCSHVYQAENRGLCYAGDSYDVS